MKQENNIRTNSDKTISGVVKIVRNENKLIIHYEGCSERWDAEAVK